MLALILALAPPLVSLAPRNVAAVAQAGFPLSGLGIEVGLSPRWEAGAAVDAVGALTFARPVIHARARLFGERCQGGWIGFALGYARGWRGDASGVPASRSLDGELAIGFSQGTSACGMAGFAEVSGLGVTSGTLRSTQGLLTGHGGLALRLADRLSLALRPGVWVARISPPAWRPVGDAIVSVVF